MTARQTIGLLLLVIFLPTCTTWSRYEGEGPPIGEARVRVHFQNGEQIRVPPGATVETGESSMEAADDLVLWNPFTVDDYYAGVANPKAPGEELRYIPVSSIERFEVRSIHVVKTALLGAGVGLVIFAAVAAQAFSDSMSKN